jgi:hypothetical protein
MLSCKTSNKEMPNQAKTVAPLLVVCVIDYSKSTSPENEVNYWDSSIAHTIYNKVADNGGGVIKVVGVFSNSLKQQVTTIDVPRLDTVAVPTNVYERVKAIRKNDEAKRKYLEQSNIQIARFIALTDRPHDEMYSDCANALHMAKVSCESKKYEGYHKEIVICSDLLHEVPHGTTELSPIELPETNISCVRPGISKETLNKLFPLSTVDIVNTTNDITFSQTL